MRSAGGLLGSADDAGQGGVQVAEFRAAADDLIHQWHQRGDTDAPMADWQTAELAVHTWDLVRATGQEVSEPPSGFVAGAWARNDAENGVASAPTGRLRASINTGNPILAAADAQAGARGVSVDLARGLLAVRAFPRGFHSAGQELRAVVVARPVRRPGVEGGAAALGLLVAPILVAVVAGVEAALRAAGVVGPGAAPLRPGQLRRRTDGPLLP